MDMEGSDLMVTRAQQRGPATHRAPIHVAKAKAKVSAKPAPQVSVAAIEPMIEEEEVVEKVVEAPAIIPKGQSVGDRIRMERDRLNMTQADIAKLLDISRAGVAQWEANTTFPTIDRVAQVARVLHTTPQWLAFGISSKPVVLREPPEGHVEVREVDFGDSPSDLRITGHCYMNEQYLLRELHCMTTSGVVVYRVEQANMSPLYEYGDRIVVDTNARRPSPSGAFLLWDGVGPALHNISILPSGSGQPKARVTSADGKTEGYECIAEDLVIIGRVRSVTKKV